MADSLKEQAMTKVMRYCSSRERAPQQVREKLVKWGLPLSQAEEIISQLKNENFLNEERFAKAYCHDKFEFNKWGKIKIRYGIQKFKLSDTIVDEGLSSIPEERYLETVNDQAQKKWQLLRTEPDSFIRRQKTANFLIRRGYESNVIYQVIDKLT